MSSWQVRSQLCSTCGKTGKFKDGRRQCLACYYRVRRIWNRNHKDKIRKWGTARWGKYFCVSFVNTDKKLVEWLHTTWKTATRINESLRGSNKTVYRTSVHSKHMCEKLIQLGIFPRKSKVPCRLPKVPTEFQVPFIRGLIDGDGSVNLTRNKGVGGVVLRVSFVDAWNEVIQDLAEILRSRGINPLVYEKERISHSVAQLLAQGKQAEKLCLLLYSDSSFCIDHKRKVWESYLGIRQEYGGLVMDHIHYSQKKQRPWLDSLGTCPDNEVARKFNLSYAWVAKVRRSLGIPAHIST